MLFNIKKVFLIILFLLFQISAFSVLILDQDGYKVLVNSKDFSITQEILSNSPIQITTASLRVGDEYYIDEINAVPQSNEFKYTYDLDTFGVDKSLIEEDTQIYFSISIFDEEGFIETELSGDPTDYYIEIDNVSSNLIKNEINIDGEEDQIELEFDKAIYIIEIYDLNDELVYEYTSDSYNEGEKKYDFNLDNLIPGSNNFKIKYYDFYENLKEEELQINVKGTEPFSINLLTQKDDENLRYYFYEGNDDILEEFYNDTIYIEGSGEFTLKFQTNKEAECVFYEGEKQEYDDALTIESGKEIVSNNKKDFEIDIPSEAENFNIVCRDSFEEIYLTDSRSSLDYFSKYYIPKQEFIIEDISPKDKVLSQSFNIYIKTNKESVCISREEIQKKFLYEDNNKKNHYLNYYVGETGIETFDISCYDKLFNQTDISHSLDIDYDSSISILNFKPQYSDKSSVDISFEIGNEEKDCYVGSSSTDLERDEKKTEKDGFKRSKTIEIYNEGEENEIYILCAGETGNIHKKTILYEATGPQINNVLVNGEVYSSDNYLKLYDINIELNSTYLIDLEEYIITLDYNSSYSEVEEKSSDKFKLSDLEGVKSITFKGINVIGNEGNEKTIRLKFDTIKPNISIKKPILTDLKIETSDEDSGIDESTIKYGFSSSSSLCYPNKAYLKNILASVSSTALFVCAEVYDKAGNKNSVIEQIREEVPILDEEETKIDEDNSADENEEDGVREDFEVEAEDPILNEGEDSSSSDEEDPFSIEKPDGLKNDESGNGLLITFIIMFLLLSIFGATFFLWYKGRFDDFIYNNLVSNPKFEKIGRKLIRRDLTIEQNINSHIRNITHKPTQYMSKTYKTNRDSKSKPTSENEISSKNKTFTPIKGIFENRFSKEKNIFDKFSDKKSKNILEKDKKEEQKDFEDFYKSKKSSK